MTKKEILFRNSPYGAYAKEIRESSIDKETENELIDIMIRLFQKEQKEKENESKKS